MWFSSGLTRCESSSLAQQTYYFYPWTGTGFCSIFCRAVPISGCDYRDYSDYYQQRQRLTLQWVSVLEPLYTVSTVSWNQSVDQNTSQSTPVVHCRLSID